MKIYLSLLCGALLCASGCQTFATNAHPASPGDITVNFHDPDQFTDVRDSLGGQTSQHYLDVLSRHLKKVAAARLTAGQKLTVTFNDIDLAGDIRPGSINSVRVIKPIYIPRMDLIFKLTDANGTILQEGKRHLSNMDFQSELLPVGAQSEPLAYDKQLLTDWVNNEFTPAR